MRETRSGQYFTALRGRCVGKAASLGSNLLAAVFDVLENEQHSLSEDEVRIVEGVTLLARMLRFSLDNRTVVSYAQLYSHL